MEAMKNRASKTFSYSVFYEQAPEGGYAALVPTARLSHPGESLEETEHNVKKAVALHLESLATHRTPIPEDGAIVSGKGDRSHLYFR